MKKEIVEESNPYHDAFNQVINRNQKQNIIWHDIDKEVAFKRVCIHNKYKNQIEPKVSSRIERDAKFSHEVNQNHQINSDVKIESEGLRLISQIFSELDKVMTLPH